MPYYLNKTNEGISLVSNDGNGSAITLKWYRAFPTKVSNKIAYNIYMDTVIPIFESYFFNKSPVFVSVDGTLTVDVIGLTPGQMYRFAVRPVEYDPTIFNLATNLPITFNNLRVYPETILRSNIGINDIIIPVLSVSEFPSTGTIKIGSELIQYTSLDILNNNLILTNAALQRGFNNSTATIHDTDGYDGYVIWDGSVLLWPIDIEDQNTVVFATEDRFDYPNYDFTVADGYRQTTKDIVNANMTVSDEVNDGFPAYDYSGYRRTDPVALFNGECVGSYFGGAIGCADGYGGVGLQIRGISVDNANTQRQEVLLSLIGEPCCLVKRQTTGIRCFCVLSTKEAPDDRCTKCYGTGFVVGYSQYFDDRRSDGRIMIRFEPWADLLPLVDSGLNVQDVKPAAWTIVLPAIKARDFIVRFDKDGNEEFRYEVIQATRNILFLDQFGAQKLALQRIRKTDIIYQTRVFRDTSTMPTLLTTSINSSAGIIPHSHTIVRNEGSPSTWNQITSINQGHSHVLTWNSNTGLLEISTEVGHSHTLVY